jgi:hypothetical protein
MNDFVPFARLVEALRPWLGHLVFVGGWAHRLHRFHPLAAPPAYLPLRTKDADVALSLEAPIAGSLSDALGAAGFKEELTGDHTPPVTQYWLDDEAAGFYAEFLVPLRGDGQRRDGRNDATAGKAGVTVQKLRHLEILLTAPWQVRIGAGLGIPLVAETSINVANPVSFVVQKLLIQKLRKPAKQPHDVLYIHDTLDLFAPSLNHLHEIWINDIRPTMAPKTARNAEAAAKAMFAGVSDVVREAARIPQDRRLDPQRLRAACDLAIREVLDVRSK